MKSIVESVKTVDRPIKVLQFGEGNFLRAFVDWIVDNLNEKAGFNGNVMMVQPLERGMGEMINAFENNGTKLNNPHRILFTTKEVLVVGVASTTSFDQFKVFHDDKDMQVYARGVGMLDAEIARANMFSVGI